MELEDGERILARRSASRPPRYRGRRCRSPLPAALQPDLNLIEQVFAKLSVEAANKRSSASAILRARSQPGSRRTDSVCLASPSVSAFHIFCAELTASADLLTGALVLGCLVALAAASAPAGQAEGAVIDRDIFFGRIRVVSYSISIDQT